nr:unnamed protein product [Callosobruchus analis]
MPVRHISAEDKDFEDFDSDDSVGYVDFREEEDSDLESLNENEKRIGRKRRSNPKTWKRNMEKKKRHTGLEHVTVKTNKFVIKKD